MARVSVILAVILSLFVLSHARLSTEPTAAAAAASSETSTDADREPSETLDQTVHFVQANEIGDGPLPTDDIFRHIEFSLRRPIYHHGHHFRHFRGHRRHRMRAMEIALGADAIGLPGDRFPLRSSVVKEGEAEEMKREKPMEEEEEIEKREDDSDSDDDEEDKLEKMEKRKRKGDCKKNKKHHHLHRFLRHRHHRHEQDEAEKIGFMKRFWDFLNHF